MALDPYGYGNSNYNMQPTTTGFNPGIADFMKSANGFLAFLQVASSLGGSKAPSINPIDYGYMNSTEYTKASAEQQANMMRTNAQSWYDLNTGKLNDWYDQAMFQYNQDKNKITETFGKARLVSGISGLGGSTETAYTSLVNKLNTQLSNELTNINQNLATSQTELQEKLNEVIGTGETPGTADIVQQTGEEKARQAAISKYEGQITDYSLFKSGDATNQLGTIFGKDWSGKRLNENFADFAKAVSADANLSQDDKINLVSEYLYQTYEASRKMGEGGLFGLGLNLNALIGSINDALNGGAPTKENFKKAATQIVNNGGKI